jgi:hypothetical protein
MILRTLQIWTRNFGDMVHEHLDKSPGVAHFTAAALLMAAIPDYANAQVFSSSSANIQFICSLALMIKYLGGGVALLALAIWGISFFFGESKFNDLALRLGVGAAVLISANYLVQLSGLTGCQGY